MITIALLRRRRLVKAPPARSRRSPRYTRQALLRPNDKHMPTPWRRIMNHGIDDDFVLSFNITRASFYNDLLPAFQLERSTTNFGSPYSAAPKHSGRKSTVTSADLLALSLHYLRTKGPALHLCPFFGLVQTSLSVWLDYSLRVLYQVVSNPIRPAFRIAWPSFEEQKASAELLGRNRPNGALLKGIFSVTDGGRFKCADYVDTDIQNAYFEGYTQQDEVTNLFVFDFKGELIFAAVNYPGSWHDSKLASVSGLYHVKLADENTPPGMAILGDSAFVNNTRVTHGKVVRNRKSTETTDIPEGAALAAIDLILQRVYPSERQSEEWGVRSLKGPFKRLDATLPAESPKRLLIIACC